MTVRPITDTFHFFEDLIELSFISMRKNFYYNVKPNVEMKKIKLMGFKVSTTNATTYIVTK